MSRLTINHLFHQGDSLEVLRKLPDASVHCCITSPPYWGLRDYGVDGQIGLEQSPEEYVNQLVEVFCEVNRVLRHDGTLWLNLGDSYAGGGNNRGNNSPLSGKQSSNKGAVGQCADHAKNIRSIDGIKSKDLVGIPWLVAFALRADGWYLRSDIIWSKNNPMPESVTDRPTKAHEYIFLLSKSVKYFYDADAIREPHEQSTLERAKYRKSHNPVGHTTPVDDVRWRVAERKLDERGRNKRTIWTIATEPFPEAHFATFPQALVEPCILAGTSEKACPKCSAPWERVVEKTGHINNREPAHVPGNTRTKVDSTGWAPTTKATDQWQPTCSCGIEETIPCVVLDPFGGSGTVSLVAKRLGRGSIYIDLNPEYLQMALKRMGNQETLFEKHRIEVKP